LHALEVFTTPIATFEDTPYQQKIVVPTSLLIMNQVEHVEEEGVEHVKEVIS
jgi:hypothetical protein